MRAFSQARIGSHRTGKAVGPDDEKVDEPIGAGEDEQGNVEVNTEGGNDDNGDGDDEGSQEITEAEVNMESQEYQVKPCGVGGRIPLRPRGRQGRPAARRSRTTI